MWNMTRWADGWLLLFPPDDRGAAEIAKFNRVMATSSIR
jgi:hypothetical protein